MRSYRMDLWAIGAHEASIVLFLPEVLDASGVTLSDLSSNANRRNNSP